MSEWYENAVLRLQCFPAGDDSVRPSPVEWRSIDRCSDGDAESVVVVLAAPHRHWVETGGIA
jgi:hypothetical protein